jgi:hypothetical protein
MHNKLESRTNKLKLRKQPKIQLTTERPEKTINICEISYLAFYINLKYSENTSFLLSLYELDCELEDYK